MQGRITSRRSTPGRKPCLSSLAQGRLKTIAILLLIFGSILALLAAGSHYIVLESFDRLERQNKIHHLDQFRSFLDSELDQLGRIAGDYAGWDAAYEFVQSGNPEFIDINLDDAIFPQLRLNLLLYADNRGTVRYGKTFDYRQKKEISLPSDLLAQLRAGLLPHASPDSRAAGIIALPAGPLMVASHPVLKSDYSGSAAGTLIVGRFLDREEIARIAGILHMSLAVSQGEDASLPAEVRANLASAARRDKYLHVLPNDTLAGYVFFPEFAGKTTFVFRADKDRLVYGQGLKVVHFFMLWGTGICLAAGGVIFFLIDRLKSGKQRLRQEHNLLEGIIEQSEDLIVAVDADCRYLIFNQAYAAEYRHLFAAEAKVGGSLADTLARVPQACARELGLWKRVLRGETFTVVGECGLAKERRMYEMKFTPLRDGEGNVTAAACIARDMTVRLCEEKALRESEQRFRVFFNNVAVGTVQLGPNGHFNRVNDRFCRMTGYSRDELLQMTPEDLAHPEDREREPFRHFLLGEGSTFRAEMRYIRKDGEIIWVEMAAGLVRDEQGLPVRTVGIVQEISARKRLEEELRTASLAAEAASRAKSEFLATMSHEIRTPMTVFMVALEHLLEIDRSPERRQFLEMADGAARRLRILIDDILDFSRIEAGRLEIDEQPFDLRECVAHVVDLLAVSARDKGLRLEMRVDAAVPPLLTGDPDRIEQVLINLVGNAIKFTEQGEVDVSVALSGDQLRIAVSDTGIGIPEEKRDMLFRHFSQVDSSLTRRHGGTGLGLAICKGLVDLMGGRIGFHSRGGGGSVFFFTLPLKTAPLPETAADRPVNPRVSENANARILLVEAEPAVRTMIQALLNQNGWRIEIAENREEALIRWREGDYNMVLMDVQLPGADGLETARQIRRHEKVHGGETCIIGLTAYADREMEKACLEAGMDSYIAKPVRMGELFAAIERCFAGSAGERRRPAAQGE